MINLIDLMATFNDVNKTKMWPIKPITFIMHQLLLKGNYRMSIDTTVLSTVSMMCILIIDKKR